MTKDQELALLHKLAADLGADSYFGPTLLADLPAIERDLRCDLVPLGLVDSLRLKCDELARLDRDIARRTLELRTLSERYAEATDRAGKLSAQVRTAATALDELADDARAAAVNARKILVPYNARS